MVLTEQNLEAKLDKMLKGKVEAGTWVFAARLTVLQQRLSTSHEVYGNAPETSGTESDAAYKQYFTRLDELEKKMEKCPAPLTCVLPCRQFLRPTI